MKNSQKNFLKPLVLLLLAVVFGSLVFVYVTHGQFIVRCCHEKQYASSNSPMTADWKTYTNSEYGFEFKYPSDLVTINSVSGHNFSLTLDDHLASGRTLWVAREFFDTDGLENYNPTSLDEVARFYSSSSTEFKNIGNFRVLKTHLRETPALVIEPESGVFISFQSQDEEIYNLLLNSLKHL